MKLFLVLVLVCSAIAQTSPFPASLDTDATLGVAADNVSSALTSPMQIGDTTAQVANATKIPQWTLITYGSELVQVCLKSGNTLTFGTPTVCPSIAGRGLSGTTVAAHNTGVIGYLNINAWYHLATSSAIKAIEGSIARSISDSFYLAAGQTLPQACLAAATAGLAINLSNHWSGSGLPAGGLCAANTIAYPGTSLQFSAGAAFRFTAGLSVPAPVKIFDYSAGGSVDLRQAKFSEAYAEWMGGAADGTTDSTAAFAQLGAAIGLGRMMTLSQGTGCYVISTITLLDGQGLTTNGNPGNFVGRSCLHSVSGGDMVNNAVGTLGFRVENILFTSTTAANAIHFNGLTVLNAVNVRVWNNAFIGTFSNSGVFVEGGFANEILSNDMVVAAPYGIKLGGASGFNNTTAIRLNIISGTTVAGIYAGFSSSGIQIDNNVLESNQHKSIWLDGLANNFINRILGNHFENNSLAGTPDYEIYVPAISGYDVNGGPLEIAFNEFQPPSAGGLGAAFIATTNNVHIHDNYGGLSAAGSGSTSNAVYLSKGVINPRFENNRNLSLFTEGGNSIDPSDGAPLFENLFRSSVDLAGNVVGSYWGTNGGDTITQDGTTFTDGIPAWKLTYHGGTSGASSAGIGAAALVTSTSHYFNCGTWVRTNTGTGTAFVTIADANGNYSGSGLNQPNRSIVNTSWQYIQLGAVTSTAAGSFIACNYSFYPVAGSANSAMYIANPQMTEDALSPRGYIPTTTTFQQRSSSPTGHTVFAQLGAASNSRSVVICDNCTVATPTATGGTGALVFPVAGVFVGR